MTPKVSIIIACYNAEKYIHRCLDSVLNQTFKDFELILIDDGCADITGVICDEYAKKDFRVRVFHRENGGVASARQCGLDNAQGDYIIYADPDDWVEKDWVLELYQAAKEANVDIVTCDFYKEYESKSIYKSEKPSSDDNREMIKDLLNEKIWGATWNKLIRKSYFDKYQIAFIPEMNLWEDLMVFTKLLHHGAKLSHIDKALYHYDCYTNSQSIVRKANLNHIHSQQIYIEFVDSIYGKDESFADSIFHCKTMIKRRIFYFGYKKNALLKSTCGEINERFIKEYGKYNGNVLYYGIALCLKGYPFIGHLFYWVMNKFYSPLISRLRQ